MKRLSVVFLAAACCAMPLAQAAGLQFLQIPAGQAGPAIDAAIWSPCAKPPVDVAVKSLVVPAVIDCPIAAKKWPLVVISHGYGGWYMGHHDTAEALADAGFVVVAINHPAANYADMSRANGLGALHNRPVDIKRTIDFMTTAFQDADTIDSERIGFYGFSQGGYTGLVLAGAQPDFGQLPAHCADAKAMDCAQAKQDHPAQAPLPLPALTRDPRIKAMVLADPLSSVFSTDHSVNNVRIALQLWGAELGGGAGAEPKDVAELVQALPQKPDFRLVPNAVHLSFLTMCSKDRMASEVCIDAPGFDRAAFHQELNTEIVRFLQQRLEK